MTRSQLLAFAAHLQAARVILPDSVPALQSAADRLVGVLTAIHGAQRWTPPELEEFGMIQMSVLARFWRDRADSWRGHPIDLPCLADLQSPSWEGWD